MKTTSKGFSTYSKVLSEEEIDDMLSNTDKLIDKAIDVYKRQNLVCFFYVIHCKQKVNNIDLLVIV